MFDVSYCSMMDVKLFYMKNEKILLKALLFSQFVLNLMQQKPNVHLKEKFYFILFMYTFLQKITYSKTFWIYIST